MGDLEEREVGHEIPRFLGVGMEVTLPRLPLQGTTGVEVTLPRLPLQGTTGVGVAVTLPRLPLLGAMGVGVFTSLLLLVSSDKSENSENCSKLSVT